MRADLVAGYGYLFHVFVFYQSIPPLYVSADEKMRLMSEAVP